MTDWKQKFNDHPVHSMLIQAQTQLGDLDTGGLTEDALLDVERLQVALPYVLSRLSISDYNLVSQATLDGLNSHLSNLHSQLSTFASNKNIGHLNNANAQLEQVLIYAAQLAPQVAGSTDDVLLSAATRFSDRVEELREQMSESMIAWAARLDELGDHASSSEQKQTELASQIQAEKERLDSVVVEIQKTAQEREDRRTDQFAETVKEIDGRINTLAEEIRQTAAELESSFESMTAEQVKEYKSSADDLIQELEKLRDDASDLVHVIGNIGATGNYKQTAANHKSAANWLRAGAIVLFLVMAGIVIFTAFQVTEIDWETVLYRFTGALIIAIPAAYMARESSKHRKQADRNRRIELELASIGPFIESLDEDERKAVKKELASKYFGNNYDQEFAADALPAGPLTKIIKMFLDASTGK